MASIYQPPIRLVLKNQTWVPRRNRRPSLQEQHGLTLLETIGTGSYAKIKKAESSILGSDVAVKIFEKRRLPTEYLRKFIPREIKVLSMLNHPNIVSIFDVFESPNHLYMVMEYAEQGDLLKHINSKMYETEKQIQHHFKQLLSAVSACHRQFITHRDLKCDNILLTANGDVKITDFGFARESNKQQLLETLCGSFSYTAPEVIGGRPYSGFKADCWSMGIILYCMLCTELPYEREELLSLAKEENIEPLVFHDQVSMEAKHVVEALLNPDPLKRLTCEELLQIDWCKTTQEPKVIKTDSSFEIITTPSNFVSFHDNDDITNILSTVVRPTYGKSFTTAIARQKGKLTAINAFKDALHRYKPMQPVKKTAKSASPWKRKLSLVSEVLESESSIITERRHTLHTEKCLRDQIRRKSLVKDVEIKPNQLCSYHNNTHTKNLSTIDYLKFLDNQQLVQNKELLQMHISLSGTVAHAAQRQRVKVHENTQPDVWFEADSGENERDAIWMKKCLISCNRNSL